MRIILLLPLAALVWAAGAACAAGSQPGTLPDTLRACADRFDALQRAEAATAPAADAVPDASSDSAAGLRREADVPLMSLARDCPEAIDDLAGPVFGGLELAGRRMMTYDWRDFATTLERRDGDGRAATTPALPDGRLAAILAELAPAPLPGVEDRAIWRERMRAWVMRQLRRWFGPDTALGRWLDDLTQDDLRAFTNGVLALVLVLFTLLVAALGLALYRFLAAQRRSRRDRHRVELPAALAGVPLLPAERIRGLPAEQQPLALMRLVLARIDRDDLCPVRTSMTNTEIARDLADAAGVRIDGLSRLADRCLFGGHRATDAELAPCWAEVDALGLRPS